MLSPHRPPLHASAHSFYMWTLTCAPLRALTLTPTRIHTHTHTHTHTHIHTYTPYPVWQDTAAKPPGPPPGAGLGHGVTLDWTTRLCLALGMREGSEGEVLARAQELARLHADFEAEATRLARIIVWQRGAWAR
jgi:hypothetical protein